jgi:uncharacterized protein (TIRG00374 family)
MSGDIRTGERWGQITRILRSVWIRITVTTALLAVVASRINWKDMGERLRHGHPLDFVIALGLVLIALVVGAYRWGRLLDKAGIHLDMSPLARVYAVSIFSNTFLPTAIGGDITRALLVVRRGPMLTRVAITIIIERIGGLVGLLIVAWVALVLRPSAVPKDAQIFLAWVTVAVIIGSLLSLVIVSRGSRLMGSITPTRLMPIARQSRSLFYSYARDPVALIVLVSLSVLYQSLISMQLVMLARAIEVHLPFTTAAVILALVTVVTLIPVSIGGFGIREGTYVVLLGGASIAATEATLISVLSVATLFLASLPGAFVLARRGVKPALEAPASEEPVMEMPSLETARP